MLFLSSLTLSITFLIVFSHTFLGYWLHYDSKPLAADLSIDKVLVMKYRGVDWKNKGEGRCCYARKKRWGKQKPCTLKSVGHVCIIIIL